MRHIKAKTDDPQRVEPIANARPDFERFLEARVFHQAGHMPAILTPIEGKVMAPGERLAAV
jgi:hypothetical protein